MSQRRRNKARKNAELRAAEPERMRNQMGLMTEYISNRKISPPELEAELLALIKRYQQRVGVPLFVYASATNKNIREKIIDHEDYITICDILRNRKSEKIHILLETSGGSAEAVEQIVRFLRAHYKEICYVVVGQAMSAGTIWALSGDEIHMTETGSLGPIDAQMSIGRSIVSAYDYLEWVEEKRMEASQNGKLNPVDATIAAQITPGEINGVIYAKELAEDLVREWLEKYKFKSWEATETNGTPVTQEMKKQRAEEIAKKLTNHALWRSHGRALKISDLQDLQLQIKDVDQDHEIADILYRIHTILRFLFGNTNTYKIYAVEDEKILRQAAQPPGGIVPIPGPQQEPIVQIEHKCGRCQKVQKVFAKFQQNINIDRDLQKQGFIPFPKNGKLSCACGFENDLLGLKNKIESEFRKKIFFG